MPSADLKKHRRGSDIRPFGPQVTGTQLCPAILAFDQVRDTGVSRALELDRSHAQRASPYLSHALAILVVADNSVSGINR